VIGCEDRLRNDLGLYCVEWGVKLYSNQPTDVESVAVLHKTMIICVYVSPSVMGYKSTVTDACTIYVCLCRSLVIFLAICFL